MGTGINPFDEPFAAPFEAIRSHFEMEEKSKGYQSSDENVPAWVHGDDAQVSLVEEQRGSGTPVPPADHSRAGSKAIQWKRRPTQKYEDDECNCCGPMDPFLIAFRLFSIVVGLCGIAAVAANLYCFAGPIGFREIVLRTYTALFSVLIVLVEMDWRFIMIRLRLLESWFFRGFFYTFLGFVTYGVQESTDDDRFLPTPQGIIGLVLGCLGALYMLMVRVLNIETLLMHSL